MCDFIWCQNTACYRPKYMRLVRRTRKCLFAPIVYHGFLSYIPLRSNTLSSGLVDARVRSVLLSNVLSLWLGVIPSIGMGGLITLSLSFLVFVGRLDSAVGSRRMSSIDGAWVIGFTVLSYAFFILR